MSIIENKKAFHDYFIEERYEAGMVLEGWEVKAIRAGRAQIKEAYVVLQQAEPVGGRHAHQRASPPPRPT
jgi:SsrA-binding protein